MPSWQAKVNALLMLCGRPLVYTENAEEGMTPIRPHRKCMRRKCRTDYPSALSGIYHSQSALGYASPKGESLRFGSFLLRQTG